MKLVALLSVFAALQLANAQDDDSFAARLDCASFGPGQECALAIDLSFPTLGDNDPKPTSILQLKAPASVELVGKVLSTQEELAGNDFLQAPFERLLPAGTTRVAFKFMAKPTAEDVIEGNLITYASHSADQATKFVRKRFKIALTPGAQAQVVESISSAWGAADTLQIGEKAESFKLKVADGSEVKLEQFRGKKNVLVVTYRAHW